MSALVTRVGNAMARSRDLKRQTDLRNIAAAIEMYAAKHGTMPPLDISNITGINDLTNNNTIHTKIAYDTAKIAGSANRLQAALGSYISSIPTDPQKKNSVKIHYPSYNYPDGFDRTNFVEESYYDAMF